MKECQPFSGINTLKVLNPYWIRESKDFPKSINQAIRLLMVSGRIPEYGKLFEARLVKNSNEISKALQLGKLRKTKSWCLSQPRVSLSIPVKEATESKGTFFKAVN